MSNGLYAIPKSWHWTTMGEISTVVGGGTPRTADLTNFEGGTIPWVTPADLSGYSSKYISHGERSITQKGLETSSARMLPAGTVLFTSRAPIGYIAIASNPVCTNQGFKSFVLKDDDVVPDYVYWWLKGNKELTESLASGTTFLELSGAKAKLIPIPIAPLAEQKRIVAEIEKQFSRLDEAVTSLERAKTNFKRYKAGVLKAAVEGKLTEQWRKEHPNVEPAEKMLERILTERRKKWEETELVKMKGRAIEGKDSEWKKKYNAPINPNTSDLPKLPDGWKWATVDQLAEAAPNAITDGPFGSNLKTEHYTSSGPRVIRLQNIGSGEFIDEKAHISEDRFQRLMRYSVRPHDVIVAALGKPAPRACLVPAMLGKALVKADCIRFRTATSLVNPGYVMYALNSEPIQKRTDKIVHGVGRPRLNLKEIKGISLPLPPKEEQDEIFDEVERRFSVTREMESELERNLRRAERLRQSILKKAFSGRLVLQIKNQSPN